MLRSVNIAAALLLGAAAQAGWYSTADPAAEFFDSGVLEDVRLTVDPGDWQTLRERYLSNDWYPADFAWRHVTISNAAIRSRGTGSRSPVKPGIRVDFGRNVRGQRFAGMTRLELKNAVQDATMLKERVSMAFYRRMGLPAPRSTHVRLWVNGEYAGLYVAVESVNRDFLRHNYGDDTGFLYQYEYWDPYRFEYRGDDPSAYVPLPFEPSTREDEEDDGTLPAMIRAINELPDEELDDGIREFLDPERVLLYIAVENYLADLDGILGEFGMANFYMYRLEGSRRFDFIAWDKDRTFSDAERGIFYNTGENVLTARMLAVPRLREAYLASLLAAADAAGGAGGWLEWEILINHFRGGEAALRDELKQCPPSGEPWSEHRACSNDEYLRAVAEMVRFTRARYDAVRAQVAAAAGE